MALPNSYTMKTGAITAYFDAILNAEAPDRFSYKVLEGLGFASSNDRLLIGILKELGFLNADGAPQERYFQFLDKSKSEQILADGIREAYSDLFAVNKLAHELSSDEAYNKLRTLYRGEKKDSVIKLISKTFVALCDYANFTSSERISSVEETPTEKHAVKGQQNAKEENMPAEKTFQTKKIDLGSLQYHINIVLPDARDQAVYDAIFKSMKDHLG